MEKGNNKNIVIILLVIIIAILITLLVLMATNIISFNITSNNKQEIVEIDKSEGSDNKEKDNPNEISNSEKYSSIIQEYRNALNDTSIKDNYDIIDTKYKNVNKTIIMNHYLYNGNEKFIYSYYDIDSNGYDELIISNDYSIIIGVYSYNGSQPIKLIDDYTLGDRSKLTIYDNGIMYLDRSSGASDGILTFSKKQIMVILVN